MKNKRVLIVGADENLLEAVEKDLSGAGYAVFQLSDARLVFEKIEEITPNVILLDIMMQGLDGLKIKAKLNEDTRTVGIPTIFLIEKDSIPAKAKDLNLGADDYVAKPLDSQALLARVNAAAGKNELYEKISTTDGLTGLWNDNFFKKQIAIFFNIAKRYKKPFSLALMDIDNLKQINNAYGYSAGDFILKKFSAIAKKTLRKADIIIRYGGDEFAIIMPETDSNHAAIAIERLKGNIKDKKLTAQGIKTALTFSVSAGIVTYGPNIIDESQMFKVADQRLSENKAKATRKEHCGDV
ncbi:MAG: diguanylate cyclase [Candidatus Omnitrophica bacterium]|nr:diguanylate cyclase [Candidatus Omnitrophota bacterium]